MSDYRHLETTMLENLLPPLRKKLGKLREQLLLIQGTDAAREFVLEEQITQTSGELDTIRRELAGRFNIHHADGRSHLEDLIDLLTIEEAIGLLHRINCDRKTNCDRFWTAFDKAAESPFQFYFISACTTQMPHSFAERMVYELISEELDDKLDAIHLRPKDDTGRLRIFRLPLSRRNLEKSKSEFKKFFSNYFEFKSDQAFDHFLKNGIPKLGYEYVAMVFELTETGWKPFVQDYYQWIIESFRQTHAEVPHFLFFFVQYLEGIHDEKKQTPAQRDILSSLDHLAQTYPGATHLRSFLPVPKGDLKAWFLDLGERNDGKIEEVITQMIKGLTPSDRALYETQQRFNMDDVEILQEIVCSKVEQHL